VSVRAIVAGAALCALSAGCGSNEPAKRPLAIPEQPDAGEAGAPAPIAVAVAAEPVAPIVRTMPAGANGPHDAAGMIGAAGAAVVGSPEMTAFVNTAEIRAHPKGEQIGRPLVAALVGWNTFMPHDLVHPLRETNWVLMSGSLYLGSTQKNVILASHTLDEKGADGVFTQLEKRLPGKRVDLKVAGVKSLEATVDGGERAYVRAKPGVLAIVPKDEGKRVAELVRRVEVSPSLRKGELVRIAFARVPRQVSSFMQVRLGPSRVWIEADGPALSLNAEADCRDDEDAARTAEQVRAALDGVRGIGGLAARSLTRDAAVWPDGKVVRYRAELDERILGLLSMAVCAGDAACGIPP
jgi:hypothetical protein